MVIAFDGRREHLTSVNEQALPTSCSSWRVREEKTSQLLPDMGSANSMAPVRVIWASFGAQLASKGFNIDTLNLSVDWDVPRNPMCSLFPRRRLTCGRKK